MPYTVSQGHSKGEGRIKHDDYSVQRRKEIIDDKKHSLNVGTVHTILPKQRHYFESKNGIIIEEISSTHFVDDSFYTDKLIMQNKERKTLLTHWRIF